MRPNRRVVMVDDDANVRSMVRVALERQPAFTLVAEVVDSVAAVEAATALQPDVVLLDSALLVVDGMDTLALIRERCPTTMVVMLSGARITHESRAEALRLGAHGYVESSGSLHRLVPHLRELLGMEPMGAS